MTDPLLVVGRRVASALQGAGYIVSHDGPQPEFWADGRLATDAEIAEDVTGIVADALTDDIVLHFPPQLMRAYRTMQH